MTTNNNKHMITNEIMRKRQIFFAHATFISLSKVLVVFNISSSHSTINLSIRRFSQEQFLIFKYLSIFHAFLHSESHVLGFHIYSFLQKPQSFNSLQSH